MPNLLVVSCEIRALYSLLAAVTDYAHVIRATARYRGWVSTTVVLFPVVFVKILDNIVALIHRYIPLGINEVWDLIFATRN